MAIDIEAPGANEADLQRALSNLMEFRGARVRLNADDTAQNITSETAISFDVADFDTDSFWSAGSPTRLTIPASKGITYVELSGQVNISSSTADTSMIASIDHYNSSNVRLHQLGPRFVESGQTLKALAPASGPVAVSAGDYFVLVAREETDNSVTIEGDQAVNTFLAIKVIGMNPV